MNAATPAVTDWVSAMMVKIVAPKKCPISGTNPQTKIMIPIAMGDGRPRINPKKVIKIAAKNETKI